MKRSTSFGPVRAYTLIAGTAAALAAAWGLLNSPIAHSTPHAVDATADLPVIVMPTVTVIGKRHPSAPAKDAAAGASAHPEFTELSVNP